MTQNEASLVRQLNTDYARTGRVMLHTPQLKKAGQSLERHGLVRYIEAASPDSSDRARCIGCDEVEWADKWTE